MISASDVPSAAAIAGVNPTEDGGVIPFISMPWPSAAVLMSVGTPSGSESCEVSSSEDGPEPPVDEGDRGGHTGLGSSAMKSEAKGKTAPCLECFYPPRR